MLLKQSLDPLAHSLITFVDELLAEVAVNLLRRDLFTGRQSDVVEVGHLNGKRKTVVYQDKYGTVSCALAVAIHMLMAGGGCYMCVPVKCRG